MKMSLKCQGCLNPLKNAFSYTPCCHSFCVNCKHNNEGQCSECDEPSTFVFKNKLLEDYGKKMTFVDESMGLIKALDLAGLGDQVGISKDDNINKVEEYKAESQKSQKFSQSSSKV